jgi:hypothetical protein
MSLLHRSIALLKPHMRPSLVIIGAQKAGTSTLYQMLRQHPEVLAPAVKEQHFFDNDATFARGLDHYWAQFPRRPLRRRNMITFEATPSYLFYADRTAPRIHAALPKVLLLALLRDPVERAYSAWNMYRDFKDRPGYQHLHDPRSFAQAVEDELSGLEQPSYRLYLARGHYSRQLAHFLDVFPRERLLVHGFTELKRDPRTLLQGLCAQLGLQEFPRDHGIFTTRANKRSYPSSLDPGIATLLRDHFADEERRLEALLKRRVELFEANVPG